MEKGGAGSFLKKRSRVSCAFLIMLSTLKVRPSIPFDKLVPYSETKKTLAKRAVGLIS